MRLQHRQEPKAADLLMVSHAPSIGIRTRSADLAEAIASIGCTVDLCGLRRQPRNVSWPAKVNWHLHQLLPIVYDRAGKNGVNDVLLPAPRVTPLAGAILRATWRELEGRPYRQVFTAAYEGYVFPRRLGRVIVYDIVDDFVDSFLQAGNPAGADRVDRFIRAQIAHADYVVASSFVLADLARDRYGREPILVPNGANVTAIREAARNATCSSEGKLRVGYVGGLESFVRIDTIIEAVAILRERGLPVELWIAGAGPRHRPEDTPGKAWIRWFGLLPSAEIPALLAQFAVGIVPFELVPFTHAALPLKVLEYGAARCVTVASPLEELRRRNFPWVQYAGTDALSWANAITTALHTPWDRQWDATVDEYDWNNIARALLSVIGPPRYEVTSA